MEVMRAAESCREQFKMVKRQISGLSRNPVPLNQNGVVPEADEVVSPSYRECIGRRSDLLFFPPGAPVQRPIYSWVNGMTFYVSSFRARCEFLSVKQAIHRPVLIWFSHSLSRLVPCSSHRWCTTLASWPDPQHLAERALGLSVSSSSHVCFRHLRPRHRIVPVYSVYGPVPVPVCVYSR